LGKQEKGAGFAVGLQGEKKSTKWWTVVLHQGEKTLPKKKKKGTTRRARTLLSKIPLNDTEGRDLALGESRLNKNMRN